jgi:signal transduction histidine kinase
LKTFIFKYTFQLLLLIGICAIASIEWSNNAVTIQTQVQSIEKIIESDFNTEQKIISEFETSPSLITEIETGFYYGIYKSDSLIQWNNPEFIITDNITSIKDGKSFQRFSNGFYLVCKKTVASKKMIYAVFKPIYSHYSFTNKFLKNEWLIDFAKKDELEIADQPNKNNIAVKGISSEIYFYLRSSLNNNFSKLNAYYLLLFFLVLILVLINITQLLNWLSLKTNSPWVLLISNIVLFGILYFAVFKFNFQISIFQSELFNPEIYASKYFESLGHLLFFSILLCWSFILLSIKGNTFLNRAFYLHIFYFLLFFITTIIIRFTIFSLVNDSSISFSVFDRAAINLFSFIGIFILAIQLSVLLFIARIWFKKFNSIIYSIAFIVVLAAISGIYFNSKLENKELELRKTLAKKLSDEKDKATEFLFKESYDKIQKDNYLKNFLQQNNFKKNEFIKFFKQRYFKGYFEKYNIEVYVLRKHWQMADLQFRTLDSICILQNKITDGLFYLESKKAENQYYSKIVIVDSNSVIATIFISFNPKSFKKDKIYPSLIVEQKANSNDFVEQIDFAIYNNNQLIRQSGNYPFPLELAYNKNLKVDSVIIFNDNNVENLILKSDSGKVIWITDYNKDLFQFLSLFGVILILLFMVGISGIICIQFKTISFNDFSFRNKVLIAICFITFLILISTGFLFSIFYARQYDDLLRINLTNKITNVQKDLMLSLENRVSKKTFHSVDESSIDELIQHLSEVHDVDINLFNAKGNLINSSQALIYENGILNPKINYSILNSILNEKKSLLINDETIGKLNFKSAYLPITNKKNELQYILSVPYFFREKELTDNFNNLIIILINVYLLLILVAFIISIFISNNLTKSFKIIKEKLAALKLGKRNEPIVWKANDEIGVLVNEYNKMIAELEINTLKLAQTERESAWREMAKQVAHEIKNPLTPMKLSIQLLERAIKDKRDDVNEMAIKVSKTLIEQIDNLTQIATQFSQFAKISSADFEVFNINEVLQNVVDLFSKQNELITIGLILESNKSLIKADKNQFISLFNNLILNAIQAIPDDKQGKIIVHQFTETDTCIITISDNGWGIDDDKLDRIFEPNFTTKSSGTGLGLAIAKTIVESAAGTINVKSKINEGTMFIIQLPTQVNPK